MAIRHQSQLMEAWPEESREAAQLVIDKYGDPSEVPASHIDAVESVLDYRVPTEKFSPLAEFDGSVVVERTAGEISARCHDEEANFLALNLAHDIVTGERTVEDARDFYAQSMIDYREGKPVA